MKLLSVILTLLILTMSGAPCPEETDRVCPGELSAASHGKPDKPGGLCDAFCSCARCPFSIIRSERVEVPAAELSPATFCIEDIKSVMSVSFAIWQPPRLQNA